MGPVQIPKEIREAMVQRSSISEYEKEESVEEVQFVRTASRDSEGNFRYILLERLGGVRGGGGRYAGFGLFLLLGQERRKLGLFLSREL